VGAVVVVACGVVVVLNCAYDEIVDIVDDGKTTAASSITMPATAIMYFFVIFFILICHTYLYLLSLEASAR
jgi:hypothetical protein